ncbi:MAG: phosphotransferase [bacterium]|nr:phosphotransferase [bacterium]
MTPGVMKKIAGILEEHYSFPINSSAIKAVSSFVFQVGKEENVFLLKIHDKETIHNESYLKRIYRFLDGKSIMPEMISTVGGDLIGSHNGELFSLSRRVENSGRPDTCLTAVAVKLAGLHGQLRKMGHLPIINHIDFVVNRDNAVRLLQKNGMGEFSYIVETLDRQMAGKNPQVIHNDLHAENIIPGPDIFFIDFNSASYKNVAFDVGNCAFRLAAGDEAGMKDFVAAYNDCLEGDRVEFSDIWTVVAFHSLQRVLFILEEQERGNHRWLGDLEKQRGFLDFSATKVAGRSD